MEENKYLDLMLLVVRITIGTAFIFRGGRIMLATLCHIGTHGLSEWSSCRYLFSVSPSLTSIIELIGGGLILTGAFIEIGALLVIPASFFAFFISNFPGPEFINPTRPQYLLNLAILAIAVGICGPGKWALWDPGKQWRKRIFESDQKS